MEYNKLADLAQELNYQSAFTYEQRADLFNKYFLSTATKYINPMMMLATHLRRAGEPYDKYACRSYPGMSHSGAVQTAFNRELKENKNKYAQLTEGSVVNFYKIFNYSYSKKDFEPVLIFKERKETEEVSFKIQNMPDFFPVRGFCFYACAEEWCKDFGFNIKFRK